MSVSEGTARQGEGKKKMMVRLRSGLHQFATAVAAAAVRLGASSARQFMMFFVKRIRDF